MCTVEEDARASARHWHTERGQSASVSVSVSAEGCRRDCKFPTRICKSSPSQRAATRRFLAGIAAGAGAKPFRGGQICSPAGLQSLGRSPRGSEQAREAASSRALSSDGRATESLGSLSTACDLLPDLAQGLQIGARETAILPEEAMRVYYKALVRVPGRRRSNRRYVTKLRGPLIKLLWLSGKHASLETCVCEFEPYLRPFLSTLHRRSFWRGFPWAFNGRLPSKWLCGCFAWSNRRAFGQPRPPNRRVGCPSTCVDGSIRSDEHLVLGGVV